MKKVQNGYSLCLNQWALDKSIKNELGLLLIISSYSASEGFCFASNEHLAELFETTTQTISRKINILKQKGYLKIDYETRGSQVIRRELRLSKMITDHYQKSQPTVIKNDKDNNTSINNISNTLFKECVKSFTGDLKPDASTLKSWAKEIEKIIRIDKQPEEIIPKVINYARNDSFWSQNFLSIMKLRKKDKNGVQFFIRFKTEMELKATHYKKAKNNASQNWRDLVPELNTQDDE